MIVDFLEVRMQNFDGSIFKALKEQVEDAHFYWRVSARYKKEQVEDAEFYWGASSRYRKRGM